MRIITLAIAGALTAATVTGCGAAANTADQAPKKQHRTFTAAEQHYLDFINGNSVSFGFTNRRGDRMLVRMGHEFCTALDGGITFDDVAQAFGESESEPKDAAALIVASTDYLCPEWAGERKAWASEFGGMSS